VVPPTHQLPRWAPPPSSLRPPPRLSPTLLPRRTSFLPRWHRRCRVPLLAAVSVRGSMSGAHELSRPSDDRQTLTFQPYAPFAAAKRRADEPGLVTTPAAIPRHHSRSRSRDPSASLRYSDSCGREDEIAPLRPSAATRAVLRSASLAAGRFAADFPISGGGVRQAAPGRFSCRTSISALPLPRAHDPRERRYPVFPSSAPGSGSISRCSRTAGRPISTVPGVLRAERHYDVVDSFRCGNGSRPTPRLGSPSERPRLLMSYDTQIMDLSQIVFGAGSTRASLVS
jgi:hypothetical protein